ncbi:peptidase M24 [Pluteus cervinus]|uniref:Peptidase M24 n=1 Tax=Pluteus cervinus TaxID=181527 RepID=A0ACD3AGW3_9AGAR|nr:peptidase M24 [Pluteus cervinus]
MSFRWQAILRNPSPYLCRRRALHRSYATEALSIDSTSKPSSFGQPLFQSHPHLLQPDELTPGIPSEDYELRRKRLMDSLPSGSAVVSVAAPMKFLSGNIFYKYRQASDFWYLTGFEEPDSAVILEKTSCSKGYKMILFSAGKNSEKEKWEGAKTGFLQAGTIFRADDALPIDSFATYLKSVTSNCSTIFVDLPPTHTRRGPRGTTKSIMKYLSAHSSRSDHDAVIDALSSSKRKPLAPEVGRLRTIKSIAERDVMRAAADISGRAHAKTMRFTRPGLSEAALAAHFEYLCSLSGAQRLAYVPVVASGPNALIIHYTSNNQVIREGEIVLIDAGCEYNGYASDITRSYPATGKFTEPQRDLYSAVLTTQKALIQLCHESAGLSLYELHRKSCELLRVELLQIGFSLYSGDLERILYPHFLSHPIGIDLHESTHFDRTSSLKEGMVITIEPGIYVPPTPNFPRHFHNIGIRIEDEVLVGKTNPVVLSVTAPKEIADVEGACQGLLGLKPF